MAAMDITRGTRRSRDSSRRRGILGIESAIVMIAFVVVAAALAFVVLNAGFGTTQKSKTTISEGLASATGAVEVAGLVTGQSRTQDSTPDSPERLEFYSIPIKLASGANAVNLQKELTAVRYFSNTIKYDNIYKGIVFNVSGNGTFSSVSDAITASTNCKTGEVNNGGYDRESNETCAFIWFSNIIGDKNSILDPGEVAVLTIVFKALDNEATPDGNVNIHERPMQGDFIRAELVPAGASSLTVERTVPVITDNVVNMG